MKAQSYFDHTGGQRALDHYELAYTPRESVPYGPRACDVVPFEADERVQHVVLASPSAGMQAPIDRDRATDRNASGVGQRRFGG
jgi:hypothetical protein